MAPRTSLPRLDGPPSLEEAGAMERTLQATVEPRFIDAMGHMNVAFYVHLFDQATWVLFQRLGIDEPYRQRAHVGMFAVEQHVRYLGELREGEALHIHSRLLEVAPKSVILLHVMIDPARTQVAATSEVVGVHIDMTSRRAVPFPEDLAARMRQRLTRED
jgi:acyl-CoA thioester hydrolase